MRRTNLVSMILLILAAFEWQCVDKYNSPYRSPATGYLVVEGYITGNGPTQFTLSHTISLPGNSAIPMETGAKVQVEGSDNSVYLLSEQSPGIYAIDTLALNTTARYRLRISTTDGQQYLSSYEPYTPTPPIDSINWKEGPTGVTIYANTHGQTNSTGYYQWTYTETWKYGAQDATSYIFDTADNTIIGRTAAQMRATCWKTQSSTGIILANTAKLSQNVIYEQPVQTIPAGSQQLSTLYSILVRQYSLTDSAYNFLTLMEQNTESLGSIFDPQPSQLTGNIQCLTTPNQPVIGWISVGTLQQQRIFISRSEVPSWIYFDTCALPVRSIPYDSLIWYFAQHGWVPVGSLQNGYAPGALQACTDCTTQGGTLTEPSFWPN